MSKCKVINLSLTEEMLQEIDEKILPLERTKSGYSKMSRNQVLIMLINRGMSVTKENSDSADLYKMLSNSGVQY